MTMFASFTIYGVGMDEYNQNILTAPFKLLYETIKNLSNREKK